MKKVLFVAVGAISLLWIAVSWTANTTVKFSTSDWDTAKLSANQQKKIFFVDFDASYCASCRNMDKSTYMDKELANYMTDNVVAHRVDVQDFDGVMWSQQYNVEALPTMLVFNEDGKLIKRLVGYKSAKDLLKVFKEVKSDAAPILANTKPSPSTPDKPMFKPVLSTEDLPNTTTTDKTTNSKTIPSLSVRPNVTTTTVEKDVPTGEGLYEIAVRKQESKGFSVQIGVYSSYKTVLEETQAFRKNFNERTLTHVEADGKFRLLAGVFPTKEAANTFRKKLSSKGIKGMVKDLTMMK